MCARPLLPLRDVDNSCRTNPQKKRVFSKNRNKKDIVVCLVFCLFASRFALCFALRFPLYYALCFDSPNLCLLGYMAKAGLDPLLPLKGPLLRKKRTPNSEENLERNGAR